MNAYKKSDPNFSEFLIQTTNKYFGSENFETIIDFGCAFGIKTEPLFKSIDAKNFTGVETNVWVRLFGKNTEIRKFASLAAILKKVKNENILFIANASLMYLSEKEKKKLFLELPKSTCIIITEPNTKFYESVSIESDITIIDQFKISKYVYNPGIDAICFVARK